MADLSNTADTLPRERRITYAAAGVMALALATFSSIGWSLFGGTQPAIGFSGSVNHAPSKAAAASAALPLASPPAFASPDAQTAQVLGNADNSPTYVAVGAIGDAPLPAADLLASLVPSNVPGTVASTGFGAGSSFSGGPGGPAGGVPALGGGAAGSSAPGAGGGAAGSQDDRSGSTFPTPTSKVTPIPPEASPTSTATLPTNAAKPGMPTTSPVASAASPTPVASNPTASTVFPIIATAQSTTSTFGQIPPAASVTPIAGRTPVVVATNPAVSAVPEPSTWAMLLLGFGSIGVAIRHRRSPRRGICRAQLRHP